MREEESRLLSWGSFLLLILLLDLCYALGEGGVTTITRNSVGWGGRLDLCYALGEGRIMTISDNHTGRRGMSDLCYALGEGRIMTNTYGRKISEGVYPPYMREDEESWLLSWGSFLLLILLLDLCYALGEGGVTT